MLSLWFQKVIRNAKPENTVALAGARSNVYQSQGSEHVVITELLNLQAEKQLISATEV